MVVNGAYRGEEATLESLDEKKFCCSIRISQVRRCVLCLYGSRWYVSL